MTKIERMFRKAQAEYNAAADHAALVYEKAIIEAENQYNAASGAATKAYLEATWTARQQEGQKRAYKGPFNRGDV